MSRLVPSWWKKSSPSRDRALSSPWERDAGLSSSAACDTIGERHAEDYFHLNRWKSEIYVRGPPFSRLRRVRVSPMAKRKDTVVSFLDHSQTRPTRPPIKRCTSESVVSKLRFQGKDFPSPRGIFTQRLYVTRHLIVSLLHKDELKCCCDFL